MLRAAVVASLVLSAHAIDWDDKWLRPASTDAAAMAHATRA